METTQIRQIVQEADRLRETNPKEAIRLYLDASEECLKLSRIRPELETSYVNEASALFLKAQSLKNNKISMQSLKFALSPPKRRFKDVAGLASLKEEIRMKIISPFKHADIYRYYGRNAGGGILMYGPPGCGKSLIAEAAAGEAGIHFFNVKSSDLKSKYVGETEKNIAELFSQARDNQPCIIFFDEFEAIGMDRMDTNHIGRGFVSQLLTEMDGIGSKDQKILFLAATNTPWLIDNALLRDGRFGNTIFVPPPDRSARIGILAKNLEGKPVDVLDLGLIADATNSFSGADLTSITNHVTDSVIKDYFQTGKKRQIEHRDFALALSKRKSSLMPWFEKAIHHIKKNNLTEHYEDLFKYIQTGGISDGRIIDGGISDQDGEFFSDE